MKLMIAVVSPTTPNGSFLHVVFLSSRVDCVPARTVHLCTRANYSMAYFCNRIDFEPFPFTTTQ